MADNKENETTILLVDGGDRQTLPLAAAYKRMGYRVVTLNSSKLDNGYSSRFPDEKILDKAICNDKKRHLEVIEKLVKTGKYDVVVTTSDDTAEGLSLMKKRLDGFAHIAVVDPELFYYAYDKKRTMEVCMEKDIPCPKTLLNIGSVVDLSINELIFPVVVKPRMSYGAIGFKKFDQEDELLKYCSELGNDLNKFVIQEYIPQTDIQYECAMFIDDAGEVKTALVFSKNRWFPVNGGSSTCNISVERPDIVETCSRLLKAIGWRGAADIDLIQDPRDNTAKVIEINPRVSGSVKIVLESGVNIAQQIVELAMGKLVTSYIGYKTGVCLRCIHTDFLWLLKSPNRFKSKPSWFDFRNTHDQTWSWRDPLPFFAFSIQAVVKYRREMRKRK